MTTNFSTRPVRVLQFGQGNFLRAFCDDFIDRANECGVYDGSIVIAQSVGTKNPTFAEQDFHYTTLLRGKENGIVVNAARRITSVREILHTSEDYDAFMAYAACQTLEAVISNTTEAGIVYDENDTCDQTPPHSFPGKLTKFLYARFCAFDGDHSAGLVVYPTELIENNGAALRDCVLRTAARWQLGDGFAAWIKDACLFCNTLVDRIVTGYPKKQADADAAFAKLGWEDAFLTIAEPFGLWVIESTDIIRAKAVLPLDRAGLPVLFTDDLTPYRERKVRILNGAHTSFVPAAFLAGEEIVRDCMSHPVIRPFIDTCIFREIIPTLRGTLDEDDLQAFALAVCERFENPFIDHALISICLNSVSKWKSRVLPSLLDAVKDGSLPHSLTLSFAALTAFYANGCMTADGFVGTREINGEAHPYTISDSPGVLAFFAEHGKDADLLTRFASNTAFWGMDLTAIPGFAALAQTYYGDIRTRGILSAMQDAVRASTEA
ncbi:MAG: tagaturonate reductase [Ruminococcaceae bacterium]|nr:tagaturonate reductase [Oscillospiraceae bacterium]